MKIALECIPCFVRQAFEAGGLVTSDNELRERILREVLSTLRVHEKISSQFQVLRRPPDKAWKCRNIRNIPSFHNAVRRDVPAAEM